MRKAYILRGLPASGKSTWAKQFLETDGSYVIINNDDIRKEYMSQNSIKSWSYSDVEKPIVLIRETRIKEVAAANKNLIVDNTHLNPSSFDKMMGLLESLDFEIMVKDFNVGVEECVIRDKKRPKGFKVGEEVIRGMYNRYILKIVKEKERKKVMNKNLPKSTLTTDKPNCLLVDIDGTLADMGDRNPFQWDKVGEDKARLHVVTTVTTLKVGVPILDIFIFSGRDAVCRDETIKWLTDQCGFRVTNGKDFYEKHSDIYNEDYFKATFGIDVTLHMRAEKDSRKDIIVKKEMYDSFIKDIYNVFVVFDDRPSVIRMWNGLGLPVFNCGVIDKEF